MSIKLAEQYFLMSFRHNKSSPEDFGLVQSPTDKHVYVCETDQSFWIRKKLYDFGWGNENGFVKLPELIFEDLWQLLSNSDVQENQYGAAFELQSKYPDELLELLFDLVSKQDFEPTKSEKKAFKLLDLETPVNRGNIAGMNFKEIDERFDKWKYISERVKRIF